MTELEGGRGEGSRGPISAVEGGEGGKYLLVKIEERLINRKRR